MGAFVNVTWGGGELPRQGNGGIQGEGEVAVAQGRQASICILPLRGSTAAPTATASAYVLRRHHCQVSHDGTHHCCLCHPLPPTQTP